MKVINISKHAACGTSTVCMCADICEQQIIDAVTGGTLDELYKRGLSQYCSSCVPAVRDIVASETQEH